MLSIAYHCELGRSRVKNPFWREKKETQVSWLLLIYFFNTPKHNPQSKPLAEFRKYNVRNPCLFLLRETIFQTNYRVSMEVSPPPAPKRVVREPTYTKHRAQACSWAGPCCREPCLVSFDSSAIHSSGSGLVAQTYWALLSFLAYDIIPFSLCLYFMGWVWTPCDTHHTSLNQLFVGPHMHVTRAYCNQRKLYSNSIHLRLERWGHFSFLVISGWQGVAAHGVHYVVRLAGGGGGRKAGHLHS